MNVQQYHARLRLLPCVVCILLELGWTPCQEIHHLGDPSERNDWMVCPLCREHHQGPTGIHGMRRRVFVSKTNLTDAVLLAVTIRLYLQEFAT